MALAIDTLPLAQALIPRLQRYLDQYSGRFQIHRVCAHATVIHDATAFRRLLESRERLAAQEALDWQADQGDDVHEGEVFHHLQQQVAKSTLLLRTLERPHCTTTLVASALTPSFTANTQGRPASSFHRQSLRCSFLKRNKVLAHAFAYSTGVPEVFPNSGEHYAWVYFPEPDLKIVWARNTGYKPFVVWNLQLDVVGLCSRITNYARPGKRRRTALNWFLQGSEPAGSGGGGVPEAKKFRGVRFRRERKTLVAEIRSPRSKHIASFGDFKTQTQAARAVDAAFHHYGKPHLLNFPHTTPALLSSQPTVAGLDAKATLLHTGEGASQVAGIQSIHNLHRLPRRPCYQSSSLCFKASPHTAQLACNRYPILTIQQQIVGYLVPPNMVSRSRNIDQSVYLGARSDNIQSISQTLSIGNIDGGDRGQGRTRGRGRNHGRGRRSIHTYP